MNQPRHTFRWRAVPMHVTPEWLMSHMNELFHTWIRHVSHECVMSHMNASCPTRISHVTLINGVSLLSLFWLFSLSHFRSPRPKSICGSLFRSASHSRHTHKWRVQGRLHDWHVTWCECSIWVISRPRSFLAAGFRLRIHPFVWFVSLAPNSRAFLICTHLSEPGLISAGFQRTGSTPAGFQEAFLAV